MSSNNNVNMMNNKNRGKKQYLSGSTMVAISAIVIILLILIYLFKEFKRIRNSKKKDNMKQYEPADCPDYWELVNGKCRNLHEIGKCGKENDVSFEDPIFTNESTGNYMKCRWAKDCSAPWEHISNLC